MTKIKVKKLIWQEWNIKHIGKHNVSVKEVEISIINFIAHKHGYKGRYILIGRSGRRIISVIVKREKANTYLVITARDADKKERRIVYEKESKQNSKI